FSPLRRQPKPKSGPPLPLGQNEPTLGTLSPARVSTSPASILEWTPPPAPSRPSRVLPPPLPCPVPPFLPPFPKPTGAGRRTPGPRQYSGDSRRNPPCRSADRRR